MLWCDSHEPRLCDDPIENPDANDPTLPMLANEPTDPIDSTEPSDHSDSTEPRDPIDQRELMPDSTVAVPTCWSPSRTPSTSPVLTLTQAERSAGSTSTSTAVPGTSIGLSAGSLIAATPRSTSP